MRFKRPPIQPLADEVLSVEDNLLASPCQQLQQAKRARLKGKLLIIKSLLMMNNDGINGTVKHSTIRNQDTLWSNAFVDFAAIAFVPMEWAEYDSTGSMIAVVQMHRLSYRNEYL